MNDTSINRNNFFIDEKIKFLINLNHNFNEFRFW